jgi:hypothetical protein
MLPVQSSLIFHTENLHHMLDAPLSPRPRSVHHSEPECLQLLRQLGIIYSRIFVALKTDLRVIRLGYRTDQNVMGVFVGPALGEFL